MQLAFSKYPSDQMWVLQALQCRGEGGTWLGEGGGNCCCHDNFSQDVPPSPRWHDCKQPSVSGCQGSWGQHCSCDVGLAWAAFWSTCTSTPKPLHAYPESRGFAWGLNENTSTSAVCTRMRSNVGFFCTCERHGTCMQCGVKGHRGLEEKASWICHDWSMGLLENNSKHWKDGEAVAKSS